MKKIDYGIDDLEQRIPNKYAAIIAIASRAKKILDNPGDVDESLRKNKPVVAAILEFMQDKLKYPEFNIKKINEED